MSDKLLTVIRDSGLVIVVVGICLVGLLTGCKHHLTGNSAGSKIMRDTPLENDGTGVSERVRNGRGGVQVVVDPGKAPPVDAGKPVSAEGGDGAAEPGPRAQPDESYPVNAMVGQVNGKAIYARTVFEPIDAQLKSLGRQLAAYEFRSRAQELISSRLYQIVADALILGEAQRSLSDVEQVALKEMVKRKREELLRLYGQGSLMLAEKNILAETGLTLDETLEEYRQAEVVKRHLQQTILPKINVTRRDIERYYNDHFEEFNAELRRTIRLIRVDDRSQADHVIELLKTGEPFEAVASLEINRFHPDEGGLMAETTGDNVFGKEPLNEAMKELDEGEYSQSIELGDEYWFIYIENLERPKGVSLHDSQLAIRQKLQNMQYRDLSNRYRRKLFEEGSYNPIDEMAARLVHIAVSRYVVNP